MLWFLVLLCISLGRADELVIDNSWGTGFQGHLDLDPNADLHGWTVHIKFDKPVETLEVQTALTSSNIIVILIIGWYIKLESGLSVKQ